MKNAFSKGDHPRICGEHRSVAGWSRRSWGSSPHMRGTPTGEKRQMAKLGIIPAYAGNTPYFCTFSSNTGDHPRICGEHLGRLAILPTSAGSSPHMRGTHDTVWNIDFIDGIIPAYAGNTEVTINRLTPLRDHPRICGEHRLPAITTKPTSGSSPHMRGTQHHWLSRWWNVGIIPAYAGNTWADSPFCQRVRDHPRICGEHPQGRAIRWPNQGSSPHMRGTREPCARRHRRSGIIPAYAGNTPSMVLVDVAAWDHPRICGEHPVIAFTTAMMPGSSPHMRGTLENMRLLNERKRIIPAYAGNTS